MYLFLNKKQNVLGLRWWLSGKESTCQCSSHGLDPWSRKIPHAMGQLNPRSQLLSPCPRAWEPQLLSPQPRLLKPTYPRASTLQQEKPRQPAACPLATTREKPAQQQRPIAAKHKQMNFIFLKCLDFGHQIHTPIYLGPPLWSLPFTTDICDPNHPIFKVLRESHTPRLSDHRVFYAKMHVNWSAKQPMEIRSQLSSPWFWRQLRGSPAHLRGHPHDAGSHRQPRAWPAVVTELVTGAALVMRELHCNDVPESSDLQMWRCW